MCETYNHLCNPKRSLYVYAISIRNFGGYPSHRTVSLHFMLLAPQPLWQLTLPPTIQEKAHGFLQYNLPLTAPYTPKNVFNSKKSGQIG